MKIVWIAIGGAALTGLAACQSMEKKAAPEVSVAPVQDVRHGFAKPAALYAIARYLQGQMLYDKAIAAYRRLLEAYPGHAQGRNALGLILAGQGRYDEAIKEFDIAVNEAPDSASLRNNLGYAYLLADKPVEAATALLIAQKLDPGNRRVADNLEAAMARAEVKLAIETAVPSTPAAIEAGEAASAQATAAESVPLALAASPEPVETPTAPVAATTFAETPAPQSSATSPATSPPPLAGAPADSKPARLEVSNANGITGLARSTSYRLTTAAGYDKARLTNEPPYRLPATQIQYRPGFEAQAHSLQTALRREVPAVASAGLRRDVQIRLVLGRDVSSSEELVLN